MGNPIDIKVAEKTPVYTWIGVSVFLAILLAVFAAIGAFRPVQKEFFVYVGDQFKATTGKNFIRQKGLRDLQLLTTFTAANIDPRWQRLAEELDSRLRSIHGQVVESNQLTTKLKETIVSAGFAPDQEAVRVEKVADGYRFMVIGSALAVEEIDGERQYTRYEDLLVGFTYTENTTTNQYTISQMIVTYTDDRKEITENDPYLYYVSHFARPLD